MSVEMELNPSSIHFQRLSTVFSTKRADGTLLLVPNEQTSYPVMLLSVTKQVPKSRENSQQGTEDGLLRDISYA